MYHSVAFLTVFVTIVVNSAVKRIRKDAEVSYTHRFKQKTECVQVVQQITRTDAQSGGGDGRIDIIPRV